MRPGLSRAVPMGILGFLVGMVILVVIRGLQGLQPLMEPELAVILGTFLAAGFFIWGMGAFDPRMNQHAHEPEEGEEAHAVVVAEEAEEEPAPPPQILGGYIWLLSSVLLGLLLIVVFFALLPGGPALQIAHEAEANVAAVGFVPLQIGSETYYFSQLTVLLGFIIFMFVSLTVVAGGLGFAVFALNQGATVVKNVPRTAIEQEPLEDVPLSGQTLVRWIVGAGVVVAGFAVIDLIIGRPITAEFATLSFFLSAGCAFVLSFIVLGAIIRFVAARINWPWLIRALVILGAIGLILGVVDFAVIWFWLAGFSLPAAVIFNLAALLLLIFGRQLVGAAFAIVTGILLPLFYFVLIGLVVPFAPPLLFGISASNALLVAALILRPKTFTRWLGYGAAWTAKQLRRLPDALQ
ncbi:MAG TPA: hypothetical protein VKY59_11975 [Spirillospora sp.]|nr:hypothetical protein [Spirillospora sp.]